METYPTIPKNGATNLKYHTYAKLDGSNIRIEYNRKQGFFKFGSRTKLIDKATPLGDKAIPLFRQLFEVDLLTFLESKKIQGATFFFELYGPSSVAGLHDYEESFDMTLIDMHLRNRGYIDPEEYNAIVAEYGLKSAPYLGELLWDEDFVTQVKLGQLPGQTFEGVVGKRFSKNRVVTNKTKSDAWIAEVKRIHGKDYERFL